MTEPESQGGPASPCPGCGLVLPTLDGPTHEYIGASPACWALYGQLLVREYGDQRYPDVHRLNVDAYAVQHPGVPGRRSIRSVAIHLIGLCLVIERGFAPEHATRAFAAVTRPGALDPTWLDPPSPNGTVTVREVLRAGAEAHVERVSAWAGDVWQAWHRHHRQVNAWVDAALCDPMLGSRSGGP